MFKRLWTSAAILAATLLATSANAQTNQLQTVSITAPAQNASYTYPATVTISATASDSDGTISKVEFYNTAGTSGPVLIGTATTPPYSISLTPSSAINYTVIARATDNQNATKDSASVAFSIKYALPTVSLTAPAQNATYAAPATIPLTATATAPGLSITQVQFYNGTTLIGSATAAPYTINWSNVAQGSYSVTAKVTDGRRQTATSAAVNISVGVNKPPTVSISAAPVTQAAPATVSLAATASDTDGSIAKVEFFDGAALIGMITQAPYTLQWANVAAGTHNVTAKATDNAGAATTSTAIPITVASGATQVYFIQTDQLNTPRVVTDFNNNVVWRWDTNEPFGNSVPNENPTGQGSFTFNFRFPGQYFDKETGLFHNGFRDYDPANGGRYIQSDPIGLLGGINTYAYVANQPTQYVDPDGLQMALPIGGGAAVVGGAAAGSKNGGSRNSSGYNPVTDMPTSLPPSTQSYIPLPTAVCLAAPAVCAAIIASKSDEAPYPDNPKEAPEKFTPIPGTGGKFCPDDGSVWERDNSRHGGEQWKRWPDKRSWEKGKPPTSVWPDGRVRK